MKLHLIFRQGIMDFKRKLQLYIPFMIFIWVTFALIFGILSFNFTLQQNYQDILGMAPFPQQLLSNFYFASSNTGKLTNPEYANDLVNYQLEDEDAPFTKYIFSEVLTQEFIIDDNNHYLRKFSPNELKALWADLGFEYNPTQSDSFELKINMNDFFQLNIINFLGLNYGSARLNDVKKYQNLLDIKDNELGLIFDEFGQIKPNLEKININYLRLAAFNKMSFYIRDHNRWFDKDPNSRFYDRNLQYGSNFLRSYFVDQKIPELQDKNSSFSKANLQVQIGLATIKFTPWQRVEELKKNRKRITEYVMPTQTWMEKSFDWSKHEQKVRGFDHVPNFFKPTELNAIKIYEQLSEQQINKIDPNILKDGTYGYVNPLFLNQNNLKLGDQISYYSTNYDNPLQKVTIIGTAVSNIAFYGDKDKSPLFIPFQKILQSNLDYIGNIKHLSFPQLAFNDYLTANDLAKEYVFNDFTKTLIPNSNFNSFIPLQKENIEIDEASDVIFLFDLIDITIAIMSFILLIVVFYFISDQSIKLQKTTLWFLKSNGENNFNLGMFATVSSIIPILLGVILGVLTSFGISWFMNSIITSFLPFYTPAFYMPLIVVWILIGSIFAIIVLFLLINWLIISKGGLSMTGVAKISLTTKLYMQSKPLYGFFSKKVRIGISFMAKNVLKNLLTFLLLGISFSVLLFSVQFENSSSDASKAFQRRFSPFESIMFNKNPTTNAVNWNMNYLENNSPALSDAFKNPNDLVKAFNLQFEKNSFYQGSINTYKIETPEKTTYFDILKNQEVELTAIKDQENQPADQQFNSLLKSNLNEILDGSFRAIDEFKTTLNLNMQLNPLYDLTNYFLDESYVKSLLTDEDLDARIDQIFGFDQNEILMINSKMMQLEALINQIINLKKLSVNTFVEPLQPGSFELILESLKEQFKQKLINIKTMSIEFKNRLNEFNFYLNIYFNRTILPPNSHGNFLTNNLLFNGEVITGIGLDPNQSKTYSMFINDLPPLEFRDDNNPKKYDYFDPLLGKDVQIDAVEVYFSQRTANSLRVKKGQVVIVDFLSIAKSDGTWSKIPLYIKDISKDSNYFREVYYNKIDLFKYLKSDLETKANNELAIEDLTQRGDYLFYEKAINALTDTNNPNAKDLYNNSVYWKTQTPYAIKNFSLNANAGTGYSIFSYSKMPFFSYATSDYSYGVEGMIFSLQWITDNLLGIFGPISSALQQFIIILSLITLAVGLILITLILFENKQIILLFKSLGYKKLEVNLYLTFGYILSAVLACFFAIGISYFALNFLSSMLAEAILIQLKFTWSWQFIFFGVLIVTLFIGSVWSSSSFYTNKQQPKYAFEQL